MNGRKARERRRESLPPDIAAESRRRISVAAAARAAKEDAARKVCRAAERVALVEKSRRFAEADAQFVQAKREILEEMRRRADERVGEGVPAAA